MAYDADQLAFILMLKSLADIGYQTPDTWLPNVLSRLKTDLGHELAENIMKTPWDEWWKKKLIDKSKTNQ